jgi:diaphanous 1
LAAGPSALTITLDISDESWHTFLKHFMSSVQDITGQELEVKPASEHDSRDVVEGELESLRTQVEELSEEVGSFV